LTLCSGKVVHEPSGYGWFWLSANKPVNKFAVLKDEHGGNTLNLELRSDARVFIDIQFGNAITPAGLRSKLFHDWPNHAARSTPGRPAVKQYWPAAARFQYLTLKSSIGNYHRFRFVRDIH
jgi:hypothetical protein